MMPPRYKMGQRHWRSPEAAYQKTAIKRLRELQLAALPGGIERGLRKRELPLGLGTPL